MIKTIITYWKYFKYFKRPKLKVYIGLYNNKPYIFPINVNIVHKPIISIRDWTLFWKSKYGTYRYEQHPSFEIVFFRKYLISFYLNTKDDLLFWETLLTMKFENTSLKEAVESNTWLDSNKNEVNCYTKNMLSKKGIKIYNN